MSLFDLSPQYDEDGHPLPKQLARREHPATSKRAARDLVDSGRIGEAMKTALAFLWRHPGSTAAELDAYAETGDGAVRKRLNDLRREGLAEPRETRACRITGKCAQVWYPTNHREEE